METSISPVSRRGFSVPGRPPPYGAFDAQDVFVTQVFGLREAGMLRIENDLRDSFVVAQIDENQSAVIAAAIYPPAELDALALVARRAARRTTLYRPSRASLMPET